MSEMTEKQRKLLSQLVCEVRYAMLMVARSDDIDRVSKMASVTCESVAALAEEMVTGVNPVYEKISRPVFNNVVPMIRKQK